MIEDVKQTARREMAFCQHVLAKGRHNVVTQTLAGVSVPSALTHYPEGEVFDPETGAQWFYHCHAIGDGEAEHGHFHCFVRPNGIEGPVHHLAAVGVDAFGHPLRLFTVNQWVVGDTWLEADATIALLARFDLHMPQPSYLVNRWLTAIFVVYEAEITDLIRARDRCLAAHTPPPGTLSHEDRGLEMVSEYRFAAP